MDRGAWQATVHGITRVGHDLVTRERERELFGEAAQGLLGWGELTWFRG